MTHRKISVRIVMLVLCLIFYSQNAVWAQRQPKKGIVSGYVFDKINHAPIAGVLVSTLSSPEHTHTDSNGFF